MKIDFKGKKALVTGATRGIGKAIADEFASLGAQLILTGTNADQIKKLNAAGDSNKTFYCVDFSDANSTKTFIKDLEKEKRIDICVNNAGINRLNLIEDATEEDWDQIIDVNLKGPFLVTKAVGKMMKKQKYGRIINIASIFGVVSKPKRSIYTTTKFGLRGLTVTASNELAPHGVLVNAVSPGFVLTDLTKKNLTKKEMDELVARVPVGRFAQPDEIAKTVLFLASDANTYLTGKNITVDGGFIDA